MPPLTFPRAGHGLCKRGEMTFSANNGLHVGMEWYITYAFTLYGSKMKVSEIVFFDIVPASKLCKACGRQY